MYTMNNTSSTSKMMFQSQGMTDMLNLSPQTTSLIIVYWKSTGKVDLVRSNQTATVSPET